MPLLNISDLYFPFNSHAYYDITFDDDEILTLLTSSPSMVDIWISNILQIHRRRLRPLVIGLDVEWRPSFNPNPNPVAILQLCIGRRCLIFQLIHAPAIPQSLIDFLYDASITFVGVGISQDALKVYLDYRLNVFNTLDLGELAVNKMGRVELRYEGLKNLGMEVLGREMDKPKNVTLSPWDCQCLDNSQVLYATIDAFMSFEIGKNLMSRIECLGFF